MEYLTKYFMCSHVGSSEHINEDLTALLNLQVKSGWELFMMHNVSVGYLMIFRRGTAQ